MSHKFLTSTPGKTGFKSIENDKKHTFVQGDICDKELVSSLFEANNIDYVVHFAAESHVDRSIKEPEIFAKTNVLGTVNITRCSNNYGPFQFPEKLIPLLINNCLQHKDLPVYGDGLNIRDWLFVEDHAKAIDMVINGGRLGEVYNVGGHNERANIQIVKTVIEYINENVDKNVTEDLIKYVEDRKGHDRRYGIAPDKIKAELGWYPETTFEVGIKKTIKWYLDNKEWMKNVTSGDYQKYYEKMYTYKKSAKHN